MTIHQTPDGGPDAVFYEVACPGPPCIYCGDEVGLAGGLPPDSTRGYPPPERHDADALARRRRLVALRRGHATLRRGRWRTLHAEGRALVAARTYGPETVLVALNAAETPATVALPPAEGPAPGPGFEVFAVGAASAARRDGRLHLALGTLSGAPLLPAAAPAGKVATVASTALARDLATAPAGRDVVVVGNIGVDTNVYLPPGWSGPVVEGAFTTNRDVIGQAGGYCSFGFRSLGLRTGFVGYVGDDPLGRWIEAELERADVDRLLFVDPAGTSRSVNLMRPDGGRNNFYDGGSHMTLAPDVERCLAFTAGARLVHLHLPNWARRLLPGLTAQGGRISCDLQDLTSPEDPYRRDFVEAADFVFFSATNVAPEPVAAALLARRPELVVVVGMGSRGAGLATRTAGFRVVPPVPHPDPVVDTNGAGDSLAVGFLTAHVLEGRPLEEAVRWGLVAARHTCTLRGGWDRLVTREALLARLAALGG